MAKIPIIFFTDYGDKDEYVGVVKSVILSIVMTEIIDLTHKIPPQDTYTATYILSRSMKFFPKRCVVLGIVDPGVGGKRESICGVSRKDGKEIFFVGPNEGYFSPIFSDKMEVFEILEYRVSRNFFPISPTFHGRDIFAPISAIISKTGKIPKKFVKKIDKEKLKKIEIPSPEKEKGKIKGKIIYIDHFGNLITNIPPVKKVIFRDIELEVKKSYSEVNKGEPVAVIGSSFTVEISIREGNAQKFFSAKLFEDVIGEE